jgi:CRISPR-associated protein Csb2
VSKASHVAYVCLPVVGFPYANGHVLGVGAVFPERLVASGQCHEISEVIGKVTSLHLGPLGVWDVTHEWQGGDRPLWTLDLSRWTQPAKTWMSATPVVLHRFPSHHGIDYYSEEMEAVVAEACVQAGLPEPTAVVLSPNSMATGAPPTRKFLGQPKAPHKRPLVHAVIRFSREVRGPVIVGAGRYMGFGLCVPGVSP